MKKTLIILISAALAATCVLSSCRKKDTDISDSTDTTAEDTTADTTTQNTTADAPAVVTTDADSDIADDGKIHVEKITLDKYSVSVTVGASDMPMVTMTPDGAENKNEIWTSDNEAVATVNKYGKITGVSKGECTVTVTSEDNKKVSANVLVKVSEAPQAAGATYINGILIVNKTYSLPSNYNPGIDPAAQAALDEMISAASAEGIKLWIASGFRSYSRQQTLYNNYVARDGQAAADRYSARPGHSEHQTGLAFDLNSLEQSFGQTAEGKWIAANCWKYGFILRYPKEKESVTGYMYEPWHVRYLGKSVAKSVNESGKCLEEYLGVTSVYAN